MSQTQVIETMPPPDVYLGPSPVHGRGVYAGRDFRKGELVEECPYLFSSERQPISLDYAFKHESGHILPLGYGMIYNHSDTPNLRHLINPDHQTMSYIANQDINMGEELFIDYGPEWWSARQYPKVTNNPSFIKRGKLLWWRDLSFFAAMGITLIVLFARHVYFILH